MIQIPVIDQNDSLTEIDLDGETFFLHLGWNSEGEFWTLGVENVNKQTLVESIALVPDFPLLGRYRTSAMPAGDMVAIAPDRRNAISRTDLPNGIVALVYITAAEIALLVAQ